MKILLLILIFLPINVVFADNPYANFDVTHNMTNSSSIVWKQTSNIQATCDNESRKRNLGGFKIKVEACSFWTTNIFGSSCTIFTKRTTNLETLGHEIRHCFQGAYHK